MIEHLPDKDGVKPEIQKILDMNDRILAMNADILKKITSSPWVVKPEDLVAVGKAK